jgi:hypothetical protein
MRNEPSLRLQILQALFLVPFHFLTPFFGVSKKMIQTPGKTARTAEVSRAIVLAAEGTQGINAPPGKLHALIATRVK